MNVHDRTNTTLPIAGSVPVVHTAPEPLMEYYRVRWRVCMTELNYLAPLLGWQHKLPRRLSDE